jgi:hypothetical protein
MISQSPPERFTLRTCTRSHPGTLFQHGKDLGRIGERALADRKAAKRKPRPSKTVESRVFENEHWVVQTGSLKRAPGRLLLPRTRKTQLVFPIVLTIGIYTKEPALPR